MEKLDQKNQKQPKVIDKRYTVKVNGEPVFSDLSKKSAKTYVAQMVLNEGIEKVSIVKEIVTETVLVELKPQTTTILVASELGTDLT